jgi:hypothetical protein
MLGNDFLMDIMEVREAIDVVSGQKQVQSLMDEIEGRMQATTRQLADAFQHQDLELALKLSPIYRHCHVLSCPVFSTKLVAIRVHHPSTH